MTIGPPSHLDPQSSPHLDDDRAPASNSVRDAPAPDAGELKRSLLRHGVWSILGRVFNLAASAFAGLVLARILNEEDFGRFNVLQTFVSLASLAAAFGLGPTAVRLLMQDRAETQGARFRSVLRRVRNWGLISHLVTGLLAVAICWIFSERLFDQQLSGLMLIAIAGCVVLRGLQAVLAEVCRGLGSPSAANLLAGASGGPILNGLLLGGMFALWSRMSDNWIAVTHLYLFACLVAGAYAAWACWICWKQTGPATPVSELDARRWPTSRDLLTICGPIALIELIGFVTEQADILIAAGDGATPELAYYTAARRASLLLRIPYAIANMAILSFIPRFHAAGEQNRLQALLGGFAALAAVPCLLFAAPLLLFPGEAMALLYRPSYAAGSGFLLVMLASQLVVVLTGSCQQLLMLTRHQHEVLAVNAVSAVLLLVGGAGAMHWGGRTALVYVVAGLTIVQNLVMWWLARKLLGYRTEPDFRQLFRWGQKLRERKTR